MDTVANGLTANKGPRSGQQNSFTASASGEGLGGKRVSHSRTHVLEAAGVCVLMLTVWILLLLPIIFYHLPVAIESADVSNSSEEECSGAMAYPSIGGVCQTALDGILSTANCDASGIPLVLRDEESTARLLLSYLETRSTTECREAVVPFLCQSLFGLCDTSGRLSLQPTSAQCLDIRDRLCVEEWRLASALQDLPDCESLPGEQVSCSAAAQNGSESGSGSGIDVMSIGTSQSNGTTSTELQSCRDDFFIEESSGLCFPSCRSWSEFTPSVTIATDVVICLSAVIGFFAAVAVIAISLIRFDRMFIFPSIFVVCLTCDLLVADIFIIITYLDRYSLYCSSPNLVTSIYEVTPFCVISGMVYVYVLLQTSIWWLIHTTALFWKIQFPFHARSFQTSHRIKYVYAACIVAGIFIPFLPIVASMADFAVDVRSNADLQNRNITFLSGGLGYGQIRFPPILCSGNTNDVVYYTSIFPINIMVIIGLTELIVLFWTIHRRHLLLKEKVSQQKTFKLGVPERKILITLFYYVLMTAFGLSRYTVEVRDSERFKDKLTEYFSCELRGYDSECDQYRDDFRELRYPILSMFTLVLITLFPAVNLVYAMNVQELKEKFHRWTMVKRIWPRKDSGTASTNVSSKTV